jgi:hypothetical protein
MAPISAMGLAGEVSLPPEDPILVDIDLTKRSLDYAMTKYDRIINSDAPVAVQTDAAARKADAEAAWDEVNGSEMAYLAQNQPLHRPSPQDEQTLVDMEKALAAIVSMDATVNAVLTLTTRVLGVWNTMK